MRGDARETPVSITFNLRLNLWRQPSYSRGQQATEATPHSPRSAREDTFPDLGSLSDKELKELIDDLTQEENEISYKRRVLHGKIDILRAELVNRLRQKREQGGSLISGDDVEQLTEILAGRAQDSQPDDDTPAA